MLKKTQDPLRFWHPALIPDVPYPVASPAVGREFARQHFPDWELGQRTLREAWRCGRGRSEARVGPHPRNRADSKWERGSFQKRCQRGKNGAGAAETSGRRRLRDQDTALETSGEGAQ